MPENIHQKEEAKKKNNEMFSYAEDRESLKQKWETAIATGVTLVEEIKIPFPENREYRGVKSMYLYRTIRNLLATLGSGLVAYGLESFQTMGRAARNIRTTDDLYYFFAIVGTIGIAIFGRLTYKTLNLFLKYQDISKDIQHIGEALLNSLIKAGSIHTDYSKLKVETSVDSWGAVFCHLEGGTTFDKSTFINALQEVIAQIDNPRYVIIRKNKFMLFMKQRDYHSVPEAIGRNKNLAEYFESQWERYIGNCDLVFTRTIAGRKLLLKSRVKSLAAQFEDKVEHINKWR